MGDMNPTRSLLLLGGYSDIGRACALAFAARGWAIRLAGRDMAALQREADDLSARHGGQVSVHAFDVLDTDAFPALLNGLPDLPDVVICAVGALGDQRKAETDPAHATMVMRSNYEGPALILDMLLERFITRGSGTIVGISSVAGDRGRASNYVYGSAKAAFSEFLSGMRNRAAKSGVHVVTVKPGFVRTRMTADMPLPAALTAEPDEVARAVFNAVDKRRNVIYTRSIWRLVMLVIGGIPEAVFKKLSL